MSSPAPALLRRLGPALLLLATALLLAGCGKSTKKADALEGLSAEQIYAEGHQAMTRGNWTKAGTTYKRLLALYPYGPYTEQAQMESAYAQYRGGNLEEAISTIDRFIRTYPTQQNIPYMYYLRGLSNAGRESVFFHKVWRLDASRRDLATPMQAYSDFGVVVDRYPDSRYAADAGKRRAELRDMFARHELDTALYYLRRSAYVSAASRARFLLESYPGSRYENDAIAALGEAYVQLGNTELATATRSRLQQQDPQHPWLQGEWPKYPMTIRRLNPFAGEKSPVDANRRD